ncbi:DNA adenine methylase [Thalassospira profundimaris]|uniref:DNA adenine methylase n=1 Tax=Thalassospira profundimaris TaxID=502049 RepID=UPI000DED415B|nr:DNA adenine methylase [Thalassospira profundimaris]
MTALSPNAIKLQPVKAVSPVAPYVGGKRLLSKLITEMISTVPHSLYAEPFVGMGGIFLRRKSAPAAEVINDISRDVFCLFRVLQDHYSYFVDYLKYQIASRAEFERLRAIPPETLTDIQRAARFVYLQRLAFGGKVCNRNFGIQTDGPARFNLSRLVPMLDDLHERLNGVVIECLPYADFITRYDHEETLFYLDPPYWGAEDYYGKEVFTREDFERLSGILSDIDGRFILSLNNTAGVRETFAAFNILDVKTRYSLYGKKQNTASEVIITNFDATTR